MGRTHGTERHAEAARPVRVLVAQDGDADADQDEGEQRADVGQVHDLVDVGDAGEERDRDAR